MTESDVTSTGAISNTSLPITPTADPSHDYPISPEGRRQAIVLLLGVVSLWVFALWSLINLFEGGLGGIEWVSLVLMLGIVLVAPVVCWALLEEANACIAIEEGGLRYRTLMGIDILYTWDDLSGFHSIGRRGKVARFFLGDDDEGVRRRSAPGDGGLSGEEAEDTEPDTRLLYTPDRTAQIKNPPARILHKLSHGASLPIYSGIERRDTLLSEITSRLSQASPAAIETLNSRLKNQNSELP